MRKGIYLSLALLAAASPSIAAEPPAPPSAPSTAPADAGRVEAVLGDDGLYHQSWFLNSFMDLKEDLAEAKAKGKRLAVLFEQKGCPYCKDTHLINFADPKVNAYIRDRFEIIQINLWGDREVTDFDGKTMPEKDFAERYAVTFTPTLIFFPDDPAAVNGKAGPGVEVARMPGYFRPFHFISMFEWVYEQRAAKGQSFQRYILEKANAN